MRIAFIFLLHLFAIQLAGQAPAGQFVKDKQSGCLIWVDNFNPADSLTITWDGKCKNSMAEGTGTIKWFVRNTEVAKYTGEVRSGNQNGRGKFYFPNGIVQEGNFVNGVLTGKGRIVFPDTTKKIEGNFVDGEILNLDSAYLSYLRKNLVSSSDRTDIYVNDRNQKDLFYYSLVPPQHIKGVLVLLPGTWDRAEYVLSNNKALAQLAYDNGFAVLVPSINQRLTLNEEVLHFLNTTFSYAAEKYKLPRDKFILGGFSMGGLLSLRYTELAYEDSSQTSIVPAAAYSVDGPADLETLYNSERRALEYSPNKAEANYALNEFKKNIGGTPDSLRRNYVHYSSFSNTEKDGGNAKYLKNVPVRIYCDVDVNWWLTNRNTDLYDMNALDQSALINFLHRIGNTKAEFINALGKGYRLDGTRHPHSWSIVDPAECLEWMKKCVE